MAIPRLNNAQLIGESLIRLEFDSPLDTDQLGVPPTNFRVNFGEDAVASYVYTDNRYVDLTVDAIFTWQSNLKINYAPPADMFLALRGSLKPSSPTVTEIRQVAVRAFSSPVLNRLEPPEDTQPKNLSLNYPRTGVARNASVDDFVLAFGRHEAIQVSNIDDPSRDEVNHARILMAIEDANSLIDSYVTQAPKAGKLLVSANRRRTSLIIARYFLDSVRRREDVTQDYERAIKELQSALDGKTDLVPEDQLARNSPNGILRVWRIPQRYNGVTGKGFSGHHTDSAAIYNSDYREDPHNNDWSEDRVNNKRRPNDLGGEDEQT